MPKTFLAILMCIFVGTMANATIIEWNCDDDGDGAIVMNAPAWTDNGGGDYTMTMAGVQTDYPAHVQGEFITDPCNPDPIVRILEDVDNSTDFAWTDYHISIGMSKMFAIDFYGSLPAGWSYTLIQPNPAGGQPIPNGGTGWLGTINYYFADSPIAIGDTGTFGFKLTFVGTTSFCTEQVPTPEPATLALLCIGGLAVIRRKRA